MDEKSFAIAELFIMVSQKYVINKRLGFVDFFDKMKVLSLLELY
jgi:hypothetical protein